MGLGGGNQGDHPQHGHQGPGERVASSSSSPNAQLRRLRVQLGRPGFQFSYQLVDLVLIGI